MVKGLNSASAYQVSSSGLSQEELQNTLSKSKQTVTDNFESNSAVKTMAGNTSDPTVMRNTLMVLPPLVLLNRFVDKIIGGSQEKSILTKVANVGDKISHVLHLDNVLSNENGSKFSNFIKNNRFTKYFTNEYKAVPKSSFAKGSTLTEKYSQELISNLTDLKYNSSFSDLFKKGKDALSPQTIKVLEGLGPLKTAVTDDYLVSLQKSLSEISKRAIEEADKEAVVELQGKISQFLSEKAAGQAKSSTKDLAENIASVLSRFADSSKYHNLKVPSSNPLSGETLKILNSVSSKTKDAVNIPADKLTGAVDDILSKGVDTIKKGGITSDPVNLSTLNNKLKAADLQIGKTGVGKLLAKGSVKTKDLITYGGGLISLAFTANALVQAYKAAKEAPKGEKKSTFMHVLSEQYIGILLFQPSINLLYKAGGNKYRGMTVEGRNALKELVQKTNANTELTKEGLKIAKMQRDLLIKGVDKDKVASLGGKTLQQAKTMAKSLKKEGTKLKFWEKPLKFMGKVLDSGLDKMQIPKFANLPILGKTKIPQPTLKGFVGGLGRLIIIMMVIQPIIQKPITKLCHKIFGEPKTYLAKNNPESSSDTKNTPGQQTAFGADKPNDVNNNETNLIKRYTNNSSSANQPLNQQQSAASTPITPNKQDDSQPLKPAQAEEIPALNIKDKKDTSNRYIPSIEVEDTSAQKDKELEKKVNDILAETNSLIKGSKDIL